MRKLNKLRFLAIVEDSVRLEDYRFWTDVAAMRRELKALRSNGTQTADQDTSALTRETKEGLK